MPQSTEQFSGIFICYRREDSGGHAGRLYDRLVAHFGDEQIFMDLDRIEPGEDFVQVIEKAVGSCEILLAVVGRGWLTNRDETGRRLDNPGDFVRVEIVAAFARDVRVIPVLVQDARMPRAQDLPEALRPLSRLQAFDLSDQRWRQDVDRLVATLERILARQREALRVAAEEEAERQHREAEARRQAETEAEAQRQAEESERLKQAAADAEQKRKAEEAERLRRESEERDRRAAEQSAPATTETTEHAEAKATAHETPAVETLPARDAASLFDGEESAPPVTTPPPAGKLERAMLITSIISLVALIVVVVWGFSKWRADETQIDANQNLTPVATPKVGQKETPSPTAETPRPPPGMVYVPGGKFTMGRDDGDPYEQPAHEVTVGPFFIDIYEVTRDDYKQCVAARQCPLPQGWPGGTYPERTERQPVTGVDWDAANAYAKWRSARDKATYRLPTEQEWEFAARGTDGRLYPWGDKWQEGAANTVGAAGHIVDVGSYKGGKSPFDAFDMAGNVWEWTATSLQAYRGGRLPERLLKESKVVRGGNYLSTESEATTTYRMGLLPLKDPSGYGTTGFRCVRDVE